MTRIIILFYTLLLTSFSNSFCKEYNLIVTLNRDCIAYHLDSIVSDGLHFEMKYYDNWIHSQTNKSQIREFKSEVINKEPAEFKADTSQLDSKKQVKTNQRTRKNSIYVENLVILPSISYDRLLSKNDKVGLVLKAGLSFYSKPIFVAESSLLLGNKVHFFEVGAGWGGKDELGLFGRVGYRYYGKGGLLLKGGILIVKNVPVFPLLGIGFSF